MPIIETLTTELGFDIDDETLESFDKAVDAAMIGLTAMVAAAAAAGAAIFAFTNKIAQSNDEIAKFAKRTGIDVEALQELGFVAELNGGSFDSMSSSLENLNRIASETARGQGAGVEAFGLLGLSVTDTNGRLKDADDLMLDVADALSQLSTQAEKAELAQKLGIGPDILLSLTQGSAAIREQRKEAKLLGLVIDKDAAAAAEKFVDSMLRVTSIVKGVSSAIGTRLIKQLRPMVDTFVEWFKVNKLLIQQNLSQFLDTAIRSIQVIFSVLARVVGVVNALVQAIGGWKVAIGAATAAMLILNASALLMPALILAAGAAIFLLVEDIVKFAEGGDSAIGNLAKKFPALGGAATALIEIFKKVVEGWNAIFKDGPELIDFTIEKIKELGKTITDFLTNPLDSFFKLVDEKFPSLGDSKILQDITNLVTGQPQIPAAAGGSSSITNNNGGATVTVNINGGDTPEVKRAIKDALNEEYRNASVNLTSPVDF
ncbi:hypothetical protein KAR91_14820 [Candidatus Pacearchaeota archaeon]|nr:hypothetical protein [Candidatus Pacearchaeota archaeon]